MLASQRIRKLVVGLVTVCLMMVAAVGTATAGAADQYRKQAAHFKKRLAKQAKQDSQKVARKDRKQTRQWLKNVDVLLANGHTDAAGRMLRRVKASLDLMDAMITAANIKGQAEKQEESYHQIKEKTIPKLKAKIKELKTKKKKLQDTLQELGG